MTSPIPNIPIIFPPSFLLILLFFAFVGVPPVVAKAAPFLVLVFVVSFRLDEEVKRRFWEGLDEIVCIIPPAERLFIGEDFNSHIGSTADGYGEVHGDFGFGDKNAGGTSLLDFTRAFELVIANSSFPKREEHSVIF
ncbi:uncharacterized protein [Nicotiana sylvestris]|uniref:Craniofacial development protein 2-like n=2 Tax=Nicotiana TaxID=4085 RepID=A0A1S3ZSZ1_TOBAC|nr:PREDICTED: craniofacial development protein 2-like [Nicotiana sylvestris]XP_016467531.1 PREDICTED: craniofacial development protein 2-like [Nicotiana tabacum]